MPSSKALYQIGLALGTFSLGLTEFTSMGTLPKVVTAFHETATHGSFPISAYAFGVVVGAPFFAAVTARMDRKKLLLWTLAGIVLGNALTAVAFNFPLLVLSRFIAGLPHGVYFGVATMVAISLADPLQRGKSVGKVIMGLSCANTIGVPIATWVSSNAGWQICYWLVVFVASLAMVMVGKYLPNTSSIPVTNPMTELGALKRPKIWFILITGMIGFGGMFAVYTYFAWSMHYEAHINGALAVGIGLAFFGLGMLAGNLIGGSFTDRNINLTIFGFLFGQTIAMIAFAVITHLVGVYIFPGIFLIGLCSGAIVPALQTKLMDEAGNAQTLAAALNNSSLNIGNALGALIAGKVITSHFHFEAPALVGALLSFVGFVFAFITTRWDKQLGIAS